MQQHLQISCARSSVQAALPENVRVPTWWPQSRAWSWWCLATGRTETRSHPPAKKDDAYGESTSQPPAKKGDVAYGESTSQMPENECAFKTPLHPSVNKCMHSLPWQIDTPITSICKTPFEVTPYLNASLCINTSLWFTLTVPQMGVDVSAEKLTYAQWSTTIVKRVDSNSFGGPWSKVVFLFSLGGFYSVNPKWMLVGACVIKWMYP